MFLTFGPKCGEVRAVVDDADEAHGEGDRWVPAVVDDAVEVAVGHGAQGTGGGLPRGVEVAAQVRGRGLHAQHLVEGHAVAVGVGGQAQDLDPVQPAG